MESSLSRRHAYCLLPPGNVVREIAQVQERLFREHRNVSFRAIPPIIPVCWLESPALPAGFPVLPVIRVRPTEYTIERRCLFLKLELLDAANESLIRAASEYESAEPVLFPAVLGFFLGAGYEGPEVPPPPASLRFETAPVEPRLISIDHTESEAWYTGVVWRLERIG